MNEDIMVNTSISNTMAIEKFWNQLPEKRWQLWQEKSNEALETFNAFYSILQRRYKYIDGLILLNCYEYYLQKNDDVLFKTQNLKETKTNDLSYTKCLYGKYKQSVKRSYVEKNGFDPYEDTYKYSISVSHHYLERIRKLKKVCDELGIDLNQMNDQDKNKICEILKFKKSSLDNCLRIESMFLYKGVLEFDNENVIEDENLNINGEISDMFDISNKNSDEIAMNSIKTDDIIPVLKNEREITVIKENIKELFQYLEISWGKTKKQWTKIFMTHDIIKSLRTSIEITQLFKKPTESDREKDPDKYKHDNIEYNKSAKKYKQSVEKYNIQISIKQNLMLYEEQLWYFIIKKYVDFMVEDADSFIAIENNRLLRNSMNWQSIVEFRKNTEGYSFVTRHTVEKEHSKYKKYFTKVFFNYMIDCQAKHASSYRKT